MRRFTPTLTLRHLTTLAICFITFAALSGPFASMWASYGQTLDNGPTIAAADGQSAPNAQQSKRDLLDRLISPDTPADASKKPATNDQTILQSQIQQSANLLVPSISANMVDSIFTDTDGDGRADPSEVLQYTVTVSNGGADPATGVKFSDTLSSNLTAVSTTPNTAAFNSSPIAFDDTGYSATGNVRISIAAASGVLTNDIDPDSQNNAGLTASAGATSVAGGNVVMAADGSFTYNPPAGFTGTDTFTYTVTDSSGATNNTGTGTVSVLVSNTIWFINNTAGACSANCDGRLTNPFTTLGNFNTTAADDPGDVIFLYQGTGNYVGPVVLLNTQRLVGQGVSLSTALTAYGITLAPNSDALPAAASNPTLANAGGNAVTIANDNDIRGLTINAANNFAILGSGVGGTATTVSNVSIVRSSTGGGLSLTNQAGTFTMSNSSNSGTSSGTAVVISGGSGAMTFSNTPISQTGGRAVDIQNRTGGTIAFNSGSTVSVTGGTTDAISLRNNTGGASTVITFANNVTLAATGSGAKGLVTDNSTGNFTVNMTASGNTLSAGTGAAAELQDIIANLTFTNTTSTNSTTQGILVNNTQGSVSFGTTAITGSDSTGVQLSSNSSTLTFGDLDITPDNGDRGFHATSNTGLITITSGDITVSGAVGVEIVGTSAASRTPLNIQFTKVTAGGATNGILIQNTSASPAATGGFRVKGNGGTCTVATPTCTGGTISATGNGIRLDVAENVELVRMRISNHADNGIFGTEVNGFILDTSILENNGNSTDECGLRFADPVLAGSRTGLSGTALAGSFPTRISNSVVRQSSEHNVEIINTSGTLTDLFVDTSAFNDTKLHAANLGADGFFIETRSNANSTIRLQNCTFNNNFTQGFQGASIDSSTLNVTVRGTAPGLSTFNNNNEGIVVSNALNSDIIFDIDTNTITNNLPLNASGAAIVATNITSCTSQAQMTGKIRNNTVNGVKDNFGVGTLMAGDAQNVVSITNNTLTNIENFRGIFVQAGESGAADDNVNANVTVSGNNVSLLATASNGIEVMSRFNSTICANITGNTANSGTGLNGILTRQRDNTRFNLQGYGGTPFDTTAVANHVDGLNPGATTVSATANNSGTVTTDGYFNATCSIPPLFDGMPQDEVAQASDNNDAAIAETSTTASTETAAVAQETSSDSSSLKLSFWKFAEHQTASSSKSGEVSLNHSAGQEERRRTTDGTAQIHTGQEGKPAQEERKRPVRDEKLDTNQNRENTTESGETLSVGGANGFTLPNGKSFTIVFRATISNPQPSITQVSNQGTVSGSNFASVVTNDPDTGTPNDPTITNIDHTTVAVTSNANPSVFGQNVTFTATMTGVPSRASDPPGTVLFKDNGTDIGTAVNVVVGTAGDNVSTAQVSISSLSVGTHVITAEYSGGGAGATKYNANIGTLSGGQVVGKANSTTGVTSSQNPSVFGQSVTFTATVAAAAPGSGTVTGTVNFLDGVNPIASCQNVALTTGQAQCTVSDLAVGNHTISASYGGDGNFNTSTGNLTGNPQVVNKANTSVGLTSSQNPSVFGQPVTFTATLSVTAPGAGSPTGTISFLDGVNPIVGCTNVALQVGQAQCQPGSLSVGNHTITATYNGDGSFNTSTGNLTGNPQVVNKADTSVGLTSSQNPATVGTNITFTASIAVTAPGAGTPTGTVQFLDGMNPIAGCTSQTVTAGQATCQTNALTAGNHTITAAYSGDGSFNTSNGSLTGNPQVITGPPALIPTVGLTRMQGSPATNSQIATVSDDVSMPGSITVTTVTVPTGITVSSIMNNNGTITANIEAACNAATGDNTIVLKATDGKALDINANLVVNVQSNAAPTVGGYANSTIVTSCKLVLVPTAAPADNGSIMSVVGTGSMGFTGNISVDAATGVVTITGNNPVGTHTITVTATDNCGTTGTSQFTLEVVAPPTAPTEYDFDGDRKADVAVYRPGATVNDFSFWFILKSTDNTVQTTQFGHDSDIIVPGDYDGDGDTEVAVFRPSINTWFTSLDPMTNYGAVQWGSAGDIPVPGRYDNDAKTDIAVFRPSEGNWYIVKSTGGTEVRSWGMNGDKPVPADYDGDGFIDVAVWRPSVSRWFIQKSGGGTTVENWGVGTDVLVPADYDGDGKDDMAVFRPSTGFWYILQSTNGGMRSEEWGLSGDVPVAADYDNDGKADLAVYRPTEGAWYIFSSCPCVLKSSSFGIATDRPIPSAFTPPAGP